MTSRVSVIGAGVIGLSVATNLLEKFPNDLQVTIIADKFSPCTISSDKSGGFIAPVAGITLDDKRAKLLEGTIDRMKSLYSIENESTNGISYGSGYIVIKEGLNIDNYINFFPDFKLLENPNIVPEFNAGYLEKGSKLAYLSSYIVSCPLYLLWLMKRFISLGGKTEERKVQRLSDLGSLYDIVINCTGLGARELVDDQQVFPSRGHIISVEAPWIKRFLNSYPPPNSVERTYIFPQANRVILGGTNIYPQDEYAVSDEEAFKRVYQRCTNLYPELKGAKIISEWVGIRPMRNEVRLDSISMTSKEGSTLKVINCYGHGHYGVSLSWGSAIEVGELIKQLL